MNVDLAVQIIEREGFANAGAIVTACEQPYRPTPARLLAMIQNESTGRNVFGGEAGATPRAWLEQEVTVERAREYWQGVLRGEGRNGIGPTQITAEDLQAGVVRAHGVDALADALHTIEMGAAYLHGLIIHFGVGEGFRHYNGSGPDAIAYRDRALVNAGEWQHRLAPALS